MITNIGREFFKLVRKSIIREDLMAVVGIEEYLKEQQIESSSDWTMELKMIERIKELAAYIEKDVENFYYVLTDWGKDLYYFDGTCIIPIHESLLKENDWEEYKEVFKLLQKRFYKAYESGNLSKIEIYYSDTLQYMLYNIFYKNMSKEDRFNKFFDMYKQNDYFLENFDKCRLEEIFSYKNNDKGINKKLGKLKEKDGFITIYRGQGSNSTSPEEAISWSTDINVALKFATRFDCDGYVLKGKVHISNVLKYYNDSCEEDIEDKEQEVVVRPGTVQNMEKLELLDMM